jgi:hypothetical protein
MDEFLRSPGAAAAVGAVGMFLSVAIIAVGCTIAVQWRKARQAELEAALKREMLQQGKSPDEIVRVLRATATLSPAELDAALKRKMINQGMSADEIVKVLGASAPAFRDGPRGETPAPATVDHPG